MDTNEYYVGKGAKSAPLRDHVRGVESGSHSTQPYKPEYCEGVTKVGARCKARPVAGGMLCVGHLRQADSLFKGGESS
jgi:hypothetical protein